MEFVQEPVGEIGERERGRMDARVSSTVWVRRQRMRAAGFER